MDSILLRFRGEEEEEGDVSKISFTYLSSCSHLIKYITKREKS